MSDHDPAVAQEIGFILLPDFALMSFASAIEPLRAANLLAGAELYRVRIFAPGGRAVSASADLPIAAEPLPRNGRGLHTVFVCAGGNPAAWLDPEVIATLRRMALDGVRLGGISGGPYVLAAAGLLQRRRFTIHWEHAPMLVETFPDLVPERSRFVIDGDRITCGGGVAPLDLMHALIAERQGADFAHRVSDWFLHTHIDPSEAPQRTSLAERYGAHHPTLLAALEAMESRIEAPLPRAAMARLVSITPRHLDRLFAIHLRRSYTDVYRGIRLDHARRLVRQSLLSISEIALAAGFSEPAHFSRAYRRHFGQSPRADRQRLSSG
ncbi:GlxA family transcriptional regulator [Devosia sp. SL43]|uniref:GlxA family transcriptional regulator n=1 Tax=Devosia sp. SL43 TaxID=2806348 RepID=UPI001F2A6E77|nr:GlxA family transcriptional regulator [Devosia sp. SL43]UJW87309.1 GlxA family transcriptional regulator [Devosia sp. SL43]